MLISIKKTELKTENLKQLLAFLLLLCLSYGCVSLKYTQPAPADLSKDLTMDGMRKTLNIYPDEFRISQRIILNIKNKEYDFIGYLVKNESDDFRALAFGEMGGRLFDFVIKQDEGTIFKKPAGMPEKPLLNGIMEDISHLYGLRLNKNAYLARRPDKKLSMVVRHKNDKLTEYLFSDDNATCVESIDVFNNKIIRKAQYMDYRLFPGWAKPIPHKIRLNNFRWGYSITIELLKINTGPVNTKMFSLQ